jgi:hypothetical protein
VVARVVALVKFPNSDDVIAALTATGAVVLAVGIWARLFGLL